MLRAQGIQKEIEREAQAEAYRCCGRSRDTRKKGERLETLRGKVREAS